MLDYTFIFDADNTWNRLSEFENDLIDFFAAYNLQAEKLDVMRGQPERSVLIIKKLDKMTVPSDKALEVKNPSVQLGKLESKLK